VASAPYPRLLDEIIRPGKDASRQAEQAFVQRDIDGVEKPGDLGMRTFVVRGGFPDARAVQVECRTTVSRPVHLSNQIVPLWQLAADLALRQLKQNCTNRHRQRLQVVELDQSVSITNQLGLEPMQMGVASMLVELNVACGVKCDRASPPTIAVQAQRDLLRHRPAGKEHSCLRP
jgi:hypothetical protein